MDEEQIDFDEEATFASDIYINNNGDVLSKDIIDEFNACQIVKDNSAEITSDEEIRIVQNMVKKILVLFSISLEPYENGNDFKIISRKLNDIKEIIEQGYKGERKKKEAEGFSNRFFLLNDRWVMKYLEKLISYFEKNAKPSRNAKNHLSFFAAVEIWKAWKLMKRETTFRYKDDGNFDYKHKEPATVFSAFVNNVKIEINEVKNKHPDSELKGLVNAINEIKSGKIKL